MAFAFEKDSDGLSRKPQKGKMKLFDPLMKFLILIIGISTSALLFGIYFILTRFGHDEATVRTFIFAAFSTYTLLVALSVRSLDKSILSYPMFSNIYLTGGISIGFVLTAAAIYIPGLQTLFGTVALSINWIIGVVLIGILNIVLIEGAKYFFKKKEINSQTKKL